MTMVSRKRWGQRWLVLAALCMAFLVMPITMVPVASATEFKVDSDDYNTERTIGTMDIDIYSLDLKANDYLSFEVIRVSGPKLTIYFLDMEHFFEATHNISFPSYDCCSGTNTANVSAEFQVEKTTDYGILITMADQSGSNSTYSLKVKIRRSGGMTTWILTAIVLILGIGVVIGLVWFSGTRRLKKRMAQRAITRRKGKGGKGGMRRG